MENREILFRGQGIDNEEWVEGSYYYAKKSNQHFIVIEEYVGMAKFHRVDPKTVGEFSGLPDKNGKKIFEGDQVRDAVSQIRGVIEFNEGCFSVRITDSTGKNYDKGQCPALFEFYNIEIIGNVFDTPELLNNLK